MKHHEQLLKHSEHIDDYPVMFCSCIKGESYDWKTTSPEEVLYIPEIIFNKVAKEFISSIGLNYHDKIIINKELIEALNRELDVS